MNTGFDLEEETEGDFLTMGIPIVTTEMTEGATEVTEGATEVPRAAKKEQIPT